MILDTFYKEQEILEREDMNCIFIRKKMPLIFLKNYWKEARNME